MGKLWMEMQGTVWIIRKEWSELRDHIKNRTGEERRTIEYAIRDVKSKIKFAMNNALRRKYKIQEKT